VAARGIDRNQAARRSRSIADRHLAGAADHLALLEEAVARRPLDTRGRDMAEALLATMRRSFTVMLTHRATVLRKLDGEGPGAPLAGAEVSRPSYSRRRSPALTEGK
jgi:hypothetical protein